MSKETSNWLNNNVLVGMTDAVPMTKWVCRACGRSTTAAICLSVAHFAAPTCTNPVHWHQAMDAVRTQQPDGSWALSYPRR